jgi:hypothetical protein
VMTLDFGTTLAGRITDNGFPYANTIGSFAGLAGAIPDALVRGSGLVQSGIGCTLDLPRSSRSRLVDVNSNWLEHVQREIRVERVPKGAVRFGTVPVNTKAAAESNVVLIGIDANLDSLERLGSMSFEQDKELQLLALIDRLQTWIVQQILNIADSEKLIFDETSLGLTGRAITTGQKPKLIAENLRLNNGELWTKTHPLVFVEDGLAMGAAVAARCMNSMGTTKHPMGGRRGDRCIMAERMKLQGKKSK